MTPTVPHIAIVEDDTSTLKALTRLVLAHGYSVLAYTSAELFLQRDASVKVDFLVLDINLSGMSGFELQSELDARGETLPIAYITGSAAESDLLQAIAKGCSAYLRKPVDCHALTFVINGIFPACGYTRRLPRTKPRLSLL